MIHNIRIECLRPSAKPTEQRKYYWYPLYNDENNKTNDNSNSSKFDNIECSDQKYERLLGFYHSVLMSL